MNKRKLIGSIALFIAGVVVLNPTLALAKRAEAMHAEAPAMAQTAKVNLNKATLEELESVRGIGPALAERIIAYRNEHGQFKTADEAVNVRGIGQAKFGRIKDQLTV